MTEVLDPGGGPVSRPAPWWALSPLDLCGHLLLLEGCHPKGRPGGQGKTRLASHIATICYGSGWVVAQAVERSPRLPTGEPAGMVGERPLLVVIDYAERWRLAVLAQLVEALALEYPRRVVRVLLLARPAVGLWEDIAAEVDRAGIECRDPIVLGELGSDRVAVFGDAVAAFAERMQVPVPSVPAAERLADPGFGSPLSLHMAALVAVCAGRGDQAELERPEDLSRFLLRHERRYWTAAEARSGGPQAAVLERLAVLGTLLGPIRGQLAAAGLLRRARLVDGDAAAAALLEVFDRLYPPGRSALAPVDGLAKVVTLSPLRPDRLGEDLVGLHLTGHPQTAVLLAELLGTQDPAIGVDELALRRCLIVLAAAGDWACHYNCGAPRGAVGSNGGGIPSSPGRRSGRVKLAAAGSGGRRGGWEQPRQSRVGPVLPDGPGPVSETGRYTRETGVDTSRRLGSSDRQKVVDVAPVCHARRQPPP